MWRCRRYMKQRKLVFLKLTKRVAAGERGLPTPQSRKMWRGPCTSPSFQEPARGHQHVHRTTLALGDVHLRRALKVCSNPRWLFRATVTCHGVHPEQLNEYRNSRLGCSFSFKRQLVGGQDAAGAGVGATSRALLFAFSYDTPRSELPRDSQ